MRDRDLSGASHPLASVQRFVTDAVRGTTLIGDDATLAAQAEALLAPSARGMTPQDRLEVYREQFWLRHLASLDEDYPTLIWVLGNEHQAASRDSSNRIGREAFRELALGYLGACPPGHWDLQWLGAGLPAYLAGDARWSTDALARDAARLDWAFMEAFDAPDSPPFDPSVLASTPEDSWPAARLELHASLSLLALDHPVHELRQALRNEAPVERPSPAVTCVVVYRDPACFLRAVAIEPLAFELLGMLRGGVPLGEACEAAARVSQRDPLEIGDKLGGWFQQWTAGGWISAVRFAS
jgi:hypothetical protein